MSCFRLDYSQVFAYSDAISERQLEQKAFRFSYCDGSDRLQAGRELEATAKPNQIGKTRPSLATKRRREMFAGQNNRQSYKEKPESNVALRLRNPNEACLELDSHTQLNVAHLGNVTRKSGNRA